MNKNVWNVIMEYFRTKGFSRDELEKLMDFENFIMDESVVADILKLLSENKELESDGIKSIENFVRIVKNRSSSGEITWEKFISKLEELELPNSPFGIRVQRFSKNSYWEIFFNHFEVVDNAKLTFNHEHYEEVERENAYNILWKNNIDTEVAENNIFNQIADKWDGMSEKVRNEVISAINTIRCTQYIDKSKVNILKERIKQITMSNADLVLTVGLRDYHISFDNGDFIDFRF